MAFALAKTLSSLLGNVNAAIVQIAKEWNENINWIEMREGFTIAAEKHKPICCIIQNRVCPACDHLKEEFKKNEDIEELSQHFVMMILDYWEVEKIKTFGRPDEQYMPRVMFFSSSGTPLRHIVNQHNSPVKYAYNNTKSILRSMQLVVEQHKKNCCTKNEPEASGCTKNKQEAE